jgi:electron transfer flavoprotein alpha subunit
MPECFRLSKYGVDKVLKVNNDKLSGFTAKPMLMSSNKLLKRKRKISFAIFYNRQYLSFISSCSSSRSRLCIKCSWTTVSTTPFQVERTAFSNKAFNITEIETEVKVLGLAKTHTGFSKLLQHLPKRILILLLVTMILV